MSSKDTDEECVMHSRSHTIEIMINDEAEFIEDLFQSLLSRYQMIILCLIIWIYCVRNIIK